MRRTPSSVSFKISAFLRRFTTRLHSPYARYGSFDVCSLLELHLIFRGNCENKHSTLLCYIKLKELYVQYSSFNFTHTPRSASCFPIFKFGSLLENGFVTEFGDRLVEVLEGPGVDVFFDEVPETKHASVSF